MSNARKTAEGLMQEYYAARGEGYPGEDAVGLLDCIAVDPQSNHWVEPSHVDRAHQILARSCFCVDDLAENHLGITLYIESLEHLDSVAAAPVYGLARPLNREITICKRAEEYEPLYRATVTHEVAHVMLHEVPRARSLSYAPDSPHRPWYEREADAFMQTALLPDSILLLGVAWVAHLYGMNIVEALARANHAKARWQWRHRYLPMLVSRLCLSRHFIGVKLGQMGMFSQDTLNYHLTYAMRNPWLPSSNHYVRNSVFRDLRDQIGRVRPVSAVG